MFIILKIKIIEPVFKKKVLYMKSCLKVSNFFMVVLISAVFLLPASFTAAAFGEPVNGPASAAVSEAGAPAHEISIYGTAAPFKKVSVPARSAGVIETAPPIEGTEIRSGEVILTVDRADYELRMELARNQQKVAEISNNQAGNENNRISKLYEASATTAQNRDNVSYANQISRANLNLTGTQVKIAGRALNETKILSPVDGIISVRYCEAGEFIDKGKPIVEVLNIDVIKANMKIPEQYINGIKTGEVIEVMTDGCGEKKFSGRICSVVPVGDAATHSFNVLALIDNTNHEIKPGMFLKGKMKVSPGGDKTRNIVSTGNKEKSSM